MSNIVKHPMLLLEFHGRGSFLRVGPFEGLVLEPGAIKHGRSVVARLKRDGLWRAMDGSTFEDVTVSVDQPAELLEMRFVDRDEVRTLIPGTTFVVDDVMLLSPNGTLAWLDSESRSWRADSDDNAFEYVYVTTQSHHTLG